MEYSRVTRMFAGLAQPWLYLSFVRSSDFVCTCCEKNNVLRGGPGGGQGGAKRVRGKGDDKEEVMIEPTIETLARRVERENQQFKRAGKVTVGEE